jgi:uncharacterized protein YkwD
MRASIALCLGLAAVFAALGPALALDINTFRAQHKLPPLKQTAALNSAAHSHAADMARRGSLDHDGFYQRMSGYSRAAENVAMIACARPDAKPVSTFAGRARGCADADCAYRMWVNSAGHRQNMLMPGLTHYGLASATAANGRRYWTLELAGERPAPVRPTAPARGRAAKKRGAVTPLNLFENVFR